MARTEQEVADEIARCERQIQSVTNKTAMVVLTARISALRWALGLPEDQIGA